jgi:hypothetical protein
MELVMIWAIWFWKLFVTLASRRFGLDPKLVHVKFVIGKVALEQIFVLLLGLLFP